MDSEEARLYYILWIAIVLMAVIIWYFIRVMIRNQANTLKAIQQQLDAQVKKSDEDRLRIVGELHDDIGPYLGALTQKIELIQCLSHKSPLLLQEAASITDRIMNTTRNLSGMLLPYNRKSDSVVSAITDFINRLHSDHVQVSFTCNNIPLLKQEYMIAICRLMQEIIHNSIKHSNAGKLKIDIRYEKNRLTIRTVEDDWKKNNKEGRYTRPGIRKTLMESRIRLLDGSLHTNLSAQYGTRYVINIPIPDKILFYEAD